MILALVRMDFGLITRKLRSTASREPAPEPVAHGECTGSVRNRAVVLRDTCATHCHGDNLKVGDRSIWGGPGPGQHGSAPGDAHRRGLGPLECDAEEFSKCEGWMALNRNEVADHLSRITTLWSLVDVAHHGVEHEARLARSQLMGRYGGAAYRYLLGALRSPEAAEELFQEFSLRFIRGDFRRADPARGRFRYFLRAALTNLITDHRKRCGRRQPLPLIGEVPEVWDREQDFTQDWRDELLARTWRALAALQDQTGRPYYSVLRHRVDYPELPSHRLAETLGTELGRPLTASGVRQMLHRSRERFAELLLDEVAQSLIGDDREQLEAELIELRLLAYCQIALKRRRARPE